MDGSIRPGDIQVGAQLVPEAETPAFPSQQQVQRSISVCPLSRRSAGGRVRIRTERQTIARPQKDRQPPVSARYNGLPSGRRAAVEQADPLSFREIDRALLGVFFQQRRHQQTVTQKEFIFAVP